MAYPAPAAESVLPYEPFANATARVNEWRGRCLDAFTRAETHATECLAAMAEIDGRGHQVDLPHLVGQRLDALSAAIGPQGPFAQEGGLAMAKLEKFRSQMQVRTMLCHGTGKVTLDLQGRWTVVLRLVSLRSKKVVREQLALTQAEATEIADDIIRMSRDLCSQLGQLKLRLQ